MLYLLWCSRLYSLFKSKGRVLVYLSILKSTAGLRTSYFHYFHKSWAFKILKRPILRPYIKTRFYLLKHTWSWLVPVQFPSRLSICKVGKNKNVKMWKDGWLKVDILPPMAVWFAIEFYIVSDSPMVVTVYPFTRIKLWRNCSCSSFKQSVRNIIRQSAVSPYSESSMINPNKSMNKIVQIFKNW